MSDLRLPYGDGVLQVSLPAGSLGEVVRPSDLPALEDPRAEFERALDNPIGSPRLEELVDAGTSIAIVVDDVTRETPVSLMLPTVLDRLHSAGVEASDIRIVLAIGTHRPMTDEEVDEKIGKEIVSQYRVFNDSSDRVVRFVHLGTSSGSVPA